MLGNRSLFQQERPGQKTVCCVTESVCKSYGEAGLTVRGYCSEDEESERCRWTVTSCSNGESERWDR